MRPSRKEEVPDNSKMLTNCCMYDARVMQSWIQDFECSGALGWDGALRWVGAMRRAKIGWGAISVPHHVAEPGRMFRKESEGEVVFLYIYYIYTHIFSNSIKVSFQFRVQEKK